MGQRMGSTDRPRRRNAGATRGAILAAARTAFARAGYDEVGVRDIAAVAGVDPALVVRYFGSKERLFAEAIAQDFDLVDLLAGDRAALGARLARYMLSKGGAPSALEPLLALLRSSANDYVTSLLNEAIDARFIRPLAAWLGGDNAAQRAALIASYVLGLAVARDIVKSQPLVEGDDDLLVALIAPILQSYVDGVTSLDYGDQR